MRQLPGHVETLIIGGGIIGLSLAYHLAKLGRTDVLLLERRELTCGTTWHAAGLVTQLRATENSARLAQYTAGLFHALEQETGVMTGFRQCGSVTVATCEDRLEELRRGASMGRSFGLDVHMIDAAEARRLYPGLAVEGVLGAAYIPSDGKTNPVDTARAFAAGARMRGARIVEQVAVGELLYDGRRITGVVTDLGEVRADQVALCAGMWTRDLAARAGVAVPLHAAEHFYIVTGPIAGLQPDLPVLRDLDARFYMKEDAGRLLLGAFEEVAKPWGMDGIPADFSFDELPYDFDHFAPILEAAVARVPVLGEAGVRLFFNGPESFTPDNRFLIGAAPNYDNLYVASGFNSCGIESSGGAGRVLAEWMIAGEAQSDLWEVDLQRLAPFQANRRYLRERTTETLGLLFGLHWPNFSPATARGVRRSPIHDRLAAAGASFGEAAGWERANFFAEGGALPAKPYGFGRQPWAEHAAREHHATRDRVAFFDQTSFAHLLVEGRDAVTLLQRVSCNDIDIAPGQVVYTAWLNRRGGIESDLTITRIDRDRFLVVTAGVQRTRDLARLEAERRPAESVVVVDMSSAYATFAIMGPDSRTLMRRLSPVPFEDDAFPLGSGRDIEFGYGRALALRMTFVGELGYELHIPTEFAASAFEEIGAAGRDLGLVLAGYHSIDSLRLEAGFRDWGHDVGPDDTPAEAGLAFTIAWDKPGFIGRDAVLAQRGRPPARRLVQFALRDAAPWMFGTEPIWRDGAMVGYIESAAYGHTLGCAVGMGYVRHDGGVTADWILSGRFEIEVAGRRIPAVASLKAFYDPQRRRARGERIAAADLVCWPSSALVSA